MGIEVRESSNAQHIGVGLFATRGYDIGDVILREEAPLARLAPRDQDMEAQMILENLVFPAANRANGKVEDSMPSGLSLRECIGSLPKLVEDRGPSCEAKFRAMIQAALCFVYLRPTMLNNENTLLELYHPNVEDEAKLTESERSIFQIAQLALEHLGELAKPESALERMIHQEQEPGNSNRLLLRVMLIWACNSFEGGRVYAQISRINHSCNPNAKVFVINYDKNQNNRHPPDEAMEIRAVTRVNAGDEISISYLDTLLYADTWTRRKALQRDKFFHCECSRCLQQADTAASTPCPGCHPRLQAGGRQLEEDVQYDDEQTVRYACPVPKDADHRVWKCAMCQWSEEESLLEDREGTETSKLFKTYHSASEKVINFLQDHETRKLRSVNDDNEEEEEADSVHAERLEQHLRLASSVLGARHWTTNILLWLQLDQTLQDFHGRLLDSSVKDDDDDTVLETIAECMDQLERICRFFDGLDLHLHRGHWLSDVIVGCARALVSLGDVKSQKYAADTLDKYLDTVNSDSDSFVNKFETEGMQKVVQTLKDAWKRNSAGNNGDLKTSERPQKRAKR